jgi:hypothetical protein
VALASVNAAVTGEPARSGDARLGAAIRHDVCAAADTSLVRVMRHKDRRAQQDREPVDLACDGARLPRPSTVALRVWR